MASYFHVGPVNNIEWLELGVAALRVVCTQVMPTLSQAKPAVMRIVNTVKRYTCCNRGASSEVDLLGWNVVNGLLCTALTHWLPFWTVHVAWSLTQF